MKSNQPISGDKCLVNSPTKLIRTQLADFSINSTLANTTFQVAGTTHVEMASDDSPKDKSGAKRTFAQLATEDNPGE